MVMKEVFWKDVERAPIAETPTTESPARRERVPGLRGALEGLRGLGQRLNLISADASAAEAIAIDGGDAFRQEIAEKGRSLVGDLLQNTGEFLEARVITAKNAFAKPTAWVAGWRERSAQRTEFAELRRVVAEQEEQLFKLDFEIDIFEHRRHDKHIRENVDDAYYSRALAKGNLAATGKVAEYTELYFDPNTHNAAYQEAYQKGDIRTMLEIDFKENGGTGEVRTLMQQLAYQKSLLISSREATAQRLAGLRQRMSKFTQPS